MATYYRYDDDGDILWGYRYGYQLYVACKNEYRPRPEPTDASRMSDWILKHHAEEVPRKDVPEYVQGLFQALQWYHPPREVGDREGDAEELENLTE